MTLECFCEITIENHKNQHQNLIFFKERNSFKKLNTEIKLNRK